MKELIKKILFNKVENRYFNYIRIFIAFLTIKYTLHELSLQEPEAIKTQDYLYYQNFAWAIKLLGEDSVWIFFSKIIFAASLLAGFFIRESLFLIFVFTTYLFLNHPLDWLNHEYLLCIVYFLLLFTPLEKAKKDPEGFSYSWSLNAIKLMMLIVYFYGGLSKITYDWFNGYPIYLWLDNSMRLFSYLEPIVDKKTLAILLSYSSFFLDLFAPVFLFIKKTKKIFISFLIVFHLLNGEMFMIGSFPYMAIFLTCLFLIESKESSDSPSISVVDKAKFYVLGLFFLIQIIIPMKRFLYSYDTLWTGESRRFGWRMMSSQHICHITFYARDKKTGETSEYRLDSLSLESKSDICNYPNHIIQTARMIKGQAFVQGREVSVHARAYASLNGRKAQELVDPNVDLSEQEEKMFGSFSWIYPLKVKLENQEIRQKKN